MSMKAMEVALRLNLAQYTAGLSAASQQTKAFGQDITGVSGGAQKDLSAISNAALGAGAVLAGAFAFAVKASLDFESELSNLQAVSGATSAELGQLRDQAIEAGAATVFSASQAAQAQVELAKAGVSTADILGGALNGALNLASAGELELADAATYAAQAMNIFNLGGAAVPRVADAMSAAANKSATDVDDVGQALQQAGLMASSMDLSMQETVGTLALFSQSALNGSDAGTAFKTFLARLTPQSKEAEEAMEDLGLSFYDLDGNFVGLEETAGRLKTAFEGLTQEQRNAAMNTLFGSDASRAANILYKEGAEGVSHWTEAVSESGYAAEQAKTKTNNLAGDLEALQGSIETNLIQAGSSANDVLRDLAQSATVFVNGIGALPAPITAAGTAIAGLGGASLLALGAAGKAIPAYRDLKTSMTNAGGASAAVAGKMDGVAKGAAAAGIAIAGLAAAFGIWEQAMVEAESQAQEIGAGLEMTALEGDMDKLLAMRGDIADQVAGMKAEQGEWWGPLVDADYRSQLGSMIGELERLDGVIAGLIGDSEFLAAATGDSREATLEWVQAEALAGRGYETNRGLLLAYTGAMEELPAGHADAEAAAEAHAEAVEAQRDAIQGLNDAVKALTDPFFGLIQAQQGVSDAATATADALQAINDAADEHGVGSEEYTAAVEAHKDALLGEAIAARDLQIAANTLNGELQIQPELLAASAAQLDAWEAEGILSAEAADQMRVMFGLAEIAANDLGATDPTVDVSAETGVANQKLDTTYQKADVIGSTNWQLSVGANTSAAHLALDRVQARIAAITSQQWMVTQQLYDDAKRGASIGQADGGVLRFFANGGMERHVAQMAPAGITRVWNEPETLGESYIPHAPSKRYRSMAVLGETADLFGMQLAPKATPSTIQPRVLQPTGFGAGSGATVVSNQGPTFHVSVNVPSTFTDDTRQLARRLADDMRDELRRYEMSVDGTGR